MGVGSARSGGLELTRPLQRLRPEPPAEQRPDEDDLGGRHVGPGGGVAADRRKLAVAERIIERSGGGRARRRRPAEIASRRRLVAEPREGLADDA